MIRYVGGAHYWPGVPARDLSEDEWGALTDEIRALIVGLGLYAAPKTKTNNDKPAGGGEEN